MLKTPPFFAVGVGLGGVENPLKYGSVVRLNNSNHLLWPLKGTKQNDFADGMEAAKLFSNFL